MTVGPTLPYRDDGTSFIHSSCFFSASSSPLLLRGDPDTAQIMCRRFTGLSSWNSLQSGIRNIYYRSKC